MCQFVGYAAARHPLWPDPMTQPAPEPDFPVPILHGSATPAAALGEMLPRLLDAISDAVVVVDRRGHIVSANKRFLDTFGLAGRPLESEPCPRAGKCLDGSGSAGSRCMVCEIAETRLPRRAIEVIPDSSGQQRRWEATLNPVLDERGEVSLVVEVWRDVTERTKLEAQLSHNERLASLGLLAAGVAHEINNPLASILAGVESLQRWVGRVELPAEEHRDVAEVLALLEQETRRCRETTDKLLLLGQPYAAKPVWVDLNRAVVSGGWAVWSSQMKRTFCWPPSIVKVS